MTFVQNQVYVFLLPKTVFVQNSHRNLTQKASRYETQITEWVWDLYLIRFIYNFFWNWLCTKHKPICFLITITKFILSNFSVLSNFKLSEWEFSVWLEFLQYFTLLYCRGSRHTLSFPFLLHFTPATENEICSVWYLYKQVYVFLLP